MITEINKCKYCTYNSNRLYNFNRHMMSKHKEINNRNFINDDKNVCNDQPNVCSDKPNVCSDKPNVCSDQPNVCNNQPNVCSDKQCYKCNKILSSKQNLKKHLLICKSVSNPLECYICHKILSDRTSKFKHLKTCKEKEKEKEINSTEIIEYNNDSNSNDLIENNNTLTKINNIITTTNSNNVITNSNNVITTNYNINLVSYNKEQRTIEFDINHMNKNLIYKLTTMHENDAYDHFCYKLFENKNNQMIIKTNLRHIYSKVHLGFNIWEKIVDNNIYHIIIYYIAETMDKYIKQNTTIEERDEKKMAEILFYIKMMYSRMTIEKYPRKYENYYKNNIESLKLKFAEFEE